MRFATCQRWWTNDSGRCSRTEQAEPQSRTDRYCRLRKAICSIRYIGLPNRSHAPSLSFRPVIRGRIRLRNPAARPDHGCFDSRQCSRLRRCADSRRSGPCPQHRHGRELDDELQFVWPLRICATPTGRTVYGQHSASRTQCGIEVRIHARPRPANGR